MLGFLKSMRRKTPAPDTALPGFDQAYYLANNPDVKATGRDPQAHFLEYGWKEGRDPSWGSACHDTCTPTRTFARQG